MDRGAGCAMWLLPKRPDHDGQGAARPQSKSERCGDPRCDGRCAVSLHDLLPRAGGDQARGASDGWRAPMSHHTLRLPKAVQDAVLELDPTSRRSFLKASGALVISLSFGTLAGTAA